MSDKLEVVGECTAGCGACCRILAMPDPRNNPFYKEWSNSLLDQGLLPVPRMASFHFSYFLGIRGVKIAGDAIKIPINLIARRAWWRANYAGTPYVYFSSVCPQLTPEGMCKLHGTGDFPEACRQFPTPLDDLGPLPECTYTIKERTDGGHEHGLEQHSEGVEGSPTDKLGVAKGTPDASGEGSVGGICDIQ